MRWAALFRRPPILRGVSAAHIRADHAVNQARNRTLRSAVSVLAFLNWNSKSDFGAFRRIALRFQGSLPRRSSIPHSRTNDPIHATRQYSSGKSSVVADRSASVMIHSLRIDQVEALRVLVQYRGEDCGNAKGNFHFRRTVTYP